MAKNERVKVEVRGKTRMFSSRALEIATKHFGAKRQSVSAREVPVELLNIPPKAEIIKPKLPEEVKEVKEVVEIPVEAQVIKTKKGTKKTKK